ncbi:hypothetical protein KKH30_04105 [Candidatus Micrarchaeota archaeon]|nr:hypothetical protein [Candidatus Micrarchaeota archaeon]
MAKEAKEEQFEGKFLMVLLGILILSAIALIYTFSLDSETGAFTEIWMEDIPSVAKAGENMPIAFTVKNSGTATGTYSYSVSAEGTTKATGFISLGPMGEKEVSESIAIERGGTNRVTVEVTPDNTKSPAPQSLWFWIDVE